MVYLSYKGANLDPKVFDDPLRFDIERPNADRQISFGFGKHFCMGANLARMEVKVVFQELFRRLPDITVPEGVDVPRGDSSLVLALQEMPAEWAMEGGHVLPAPGTEADWMRAHWAEHEEDLTLAE